MDGTAAVGASTNFARQDHVHPSNTARVAKAGDTMTGVLNINNTTAATTPTSGALTVAGGAGIAGAVNAGDTVKVTPAQFTLKQAIHTEQTGPTNYYTAGTSFDWNSIQVVYDNITTNAGGVCSRGLNVFLQNGGNDNGTKMAFQAQIQHSVASNPGAAYGDYIAGQFVAQGDKDWGGTNTGAGSVGTLFAAGLYVSASGTATNLLEVCGSEVDVGLYDSATCRYRFGLSVAGIGVRQGVEADAAFEVAAAGCSWRHGLLFAGFHGTPPVSTDGTMIGTDPVGCTVTNGIDFSAYTFTGSFLKGPGFTVTGAGKTAVGDTTASTSPTSGSLTVAGGLGVNGSIFAGGIINVNGSINAGGDINAADIYTRRAGAPTNGIVCFGNSGTAYLTYSPSIYTLVGGKLNITDTTVSSSNSTGALTLAGGLGIGGNVNTNGTIIASGAITAGGNVSGVDFNASNIYTRTAATPTQGFVGFGNAGGKYLNFDSAAFNLVGGKLNITDTTVATLSTNGALTVAGGVGAGGDVRVGGHIALDTAAKYIAFNGGNQGLGSVGGVGGRRGITVAADAIAGFNAKEAIYLLRDESAGGFALVISAPGEGVANILFQTSTNFTTTDPGVGGSKWFISSADGSVRNRYATSKALSYAILSCQTMTVV